MIINIDRNVMGYSKKSIYKIISNIDKRILSYDSIDIKSVVLYEGQIGNDVIYHLVSYNWTGESSHNYIGSSKYGSKVIDGFGHCEVPNLEQSLRDIKLIELGIS